MTTSVATPTGSRAVVSIGRVVVGRVEDGLHPGRSVRQTAGRAAERERRHRRGAAVQGHGAPATRNPVDQ